MEKGAEKTEITGNKDANEDVVKVKFCDYGHGEETVPVFSPEGELMVDELLPYLYNNFVIDVPSETLRKVIALREKLYMEEAPIVRELIEAVHDVDDGLFQKSFVKLMTRDCLLDDICKGHRFRVFVFERAVKEIECIKIVARLLSRTVFTAFDDDLK